MKKIILINFLIIFLCCGCTVDYTLKINKDLTIKEEISAMETKKIISDYVNSNPEEVIDMLASSNGLSSNEYEKILKKSEFGVKIKNEYSSIEEYSSKSEYYTQYFSDIKYSKKDNIVSLRLDSNIINDRDYPNAFEIEKTVIKIKVPYTVVSSNADKIEKLTNTYIWYIYDDTDSKDIKLDFDTSKSGFDFSFIIKYLPIVLIILLLVGIGYVFFKVLKVKNLENNKF